MSSGIVNTLPEFDPPSMPGPDPRRGAGPSTRTPGRLLFGARRGGLLLLAAAVQIGCATAPAGRGLPSSVERFLDRNGWDLDGYESSDLESLDGYFFHNRSYSSPAPSEIVWKAYASLEPSEAWNTSRTRPGVVWDPSGSRLYAPDETAPPFAAGQILVLDVRIFGPFRIPASFRITRIDEPERLIEFVYLKRNLSNGVQRIRFLDRTGQGGSPCTVIVHSTWYRSGRPFRDKSLYGPIHTRIIDAFHAGVFRRSGLPLDAPE